METVKNERLEKLSNDARHGIPISLDEALEVIEYQEGLKKVKKKSVIQRVINWFN
jgi:hypothetical protein